MQSSITTVSVSWQEQITQVCNKHSNVIQEAQLRHTQDLLEQTGENDKRFQNFHEFLVDNSRAWVAVVET